MEASLIQCAGRALPVTAPLAEVFGGSCIRVGTIMEGFHGWRQANRRFVAEHRLVRKPMGAGTRSVKADGARTFLSAATYRTQYLQQIRSALGVRKLLRTGMSALRRP